MAKRMIAVLRPNPMRSELAEVLDSMGMSRGGYHVRVHCPSDGRAFVAEKYMGEWGQPGGWCCRPAHPTPAQQEGDKQ